MDLWWKRGTPKDGHLELVQGVWLQGEGGRGTRREPNASHACSSSVHCTIVCGVGGDDFGKVSGSGGDVVCEPEEVFELVTDCRSYFYAFGVGFQCMLKEGEAASTARHGKAHASKFPKKLVPVGDRRTFS